jgi:hypothetical protein
MVLSGLLFSFDKLNEIVSTKGKVPIVADLMASRWGYEGVAVRQFMTNDYESKFYTFEQKELQSDFKSSYWTKEIKHRLNYVMDHYESSDEDKLKKVKRYLGVIQHELIEDAGTNMVNDLDLLVALDPEKFNASIGNEIIKYIDTLSKKYLDQYNLAVQKKDKLIYGYENTFNYDLNEMKDKHFNESLTDLVRNLNVKNRVIEFKGRLLQIVDPVFNEPKNPKNLLDYRTHFFAPKKHFLGVYFDTYWFNISVIWIMTLILYITLYFEWIKKLIGVTESISKKIKHKESN